MVGAKSVNGPVCGNDKASTKSAAVKAFIKVVYPFSWAVLGISSKGCSVGPSVGSGAVVVGKSVGR